MTSAALLATEITSRGNEEWAQGRNLNMDTIGAVEEEPNLQYPRR